MLVTAHGVQEAVSAVDSGVSGVPPVRGIEIRGLRRIDEGAVRTRMKLRVGEPLSMEKVSDDIKAVFGMGYFEDVSVEVEPFEGGVDLVFVFIEKPTIRGVEFFGNLGVDDAKVEEAITISPGAMADTVLIQDNAVILTSVYEGEGYPLANIIPVVRRIGRGHTLLTYLIEEGPRVKVQEISFQGNVNVESGDLRGAMKTSEWWLLSPITSGGRYEKQKVEEDLRSIRDVYYDKGFLEVVVSAPTIKFSEDREWMNIAIGIAEGSQYRISSTGFTGNELFEEEELRGNVKLLPGDVLSKKRLGGDVDTLTGMYSEKGYALANVYPDIVPDEESTEAAVIFKIHEGEPYDVGSINITGNMKTRDKVIRREVRLDEGDLYNSKLLKRSYQRILNLKYFDEVKLKPVPRVGTREMDIDIDVGERSTGQLVVGAGYSSVDKFIASVEFSQGNLWGRGQTLKLKSEFGNISSTYELSFTEPWLMDRQVLFYYALYRTKREYNSYDKKAFGSAVGLGKSFMEYWSGRLTYKIEDVEITDIDEDASNVIKEQEGKKLTSAITPAITRDTRDNVLDTHTGSRNKVYFTFAGLGGDNRFYKFGGDTHWFLPLTKKTTVSLRARYSQADGLFGKTLPLYERFEVGDISTVRGHRDVGPEDEDGEYIGGKKRLIFNIEYIFPLMAEINLKGITFFDAGSAFDKFEDLELMYSTGLGIRWISPIGPLRLEWAYLINAEPEDKDNRWEFSIGTFF
jgi:outer membrane protein insertion porin family